MSFLPFQTLSEDIILCQRCKCSITAPKSATEALRKIPDIHHPTPTEAKYISELMLEAQADLARFSQTIDGLQSLIARLERQRESVRTSIEMYRDLQAPVCRLPTEILADIFLHCHTSIREDWQATLAHKKGLAALNLGLVCRRWRDIALSLPELWTSISLDLDVAWGPREEDLDEEMMLLLQVILQAYLQRSGDHTLSIYISATEFFPYHRSPEIITDVVSQSHRWRSLTLDLECAFSEQWSDSFDPLRGPEGFPALEDLTILGDDIDFPHDCTTFRDCPKLHTLTLSAHIETATSLLNFPYGQIQVLRLEGSEISLSRLTDCVRLVRLEIDSAGDFDARIDVHKKSNVQYLSLSVSSQEWSDEAKQMTDMLDKLTLPSLRSFKINAAPVLPRGVVYLTNEWSSAFSSLLSRSECPLETLCLDDMKMAPDDLLTILTSAPSTLKTLRLREVITEWLPEYENDKSPVVPDSILQSLTYDYNSLGLPLLPRLTHFDYAPHPSVTDEILLAMIESRWSPTTIYSSGSRGVACIESVALVSKRHPFGPSIIDRLKKLGKEGLKVTVDGQRISLASPLR